MADNTSGFMNNSVVKWIEYRLPLFSTLDHMVGSQYPTPKNLNYWWNFGSLAGLCLVIQLATAIVLVMHYTPHISMDFDSVLQLMRNVNYVWLLRHMPPNDPALLFIADYLHTFPGLHYSC